MSIEVLESYSLGRLKADRIPDLEHHLLICQGCRAKLHGIEPYNFVHFTREGLFYSRVTRLRNGKLLARHWGRSLEGGKEFKTTTGAKAYLERTFLRIFPEHECLSRCGATDAV